MAKQSNLSFLTVNTEKWYNNGATLGILLFIIPPIGIYAVLKNENIQSKLMKTLIILFSITVFYNEIKAVLRLIA
jgi:hypothetical protein